MKISKQAVEEFQQIYEKEIQQKITYEQAERMAMNLLRIFSVIYRPIKKYEYANK